MTIILAIHQLLDFEIGSNKPMNHLVAMMESEPGVLRACVVEMIVTIINMLGPNAPGQALACRP
jgi:hypothetical protein